LKVFWGLFIFSFYGWISLYTQEQNPSSDWKYKTYGSLEYLESRFVSKKDFSRYNLLQEIKYQNQIKMSAEIRHEKSFANFEYKNQYIYFSSGHRYKPLQGFYILRDEKYYSAFQNPMHGIVPQPLQRSTWLGASWKGWLTGIFSGQNFSENKPAIFIQSPNEILGFAYSREKEIYFASINLRKWQWKKQRNVPEISVVSEWIGRKEKYIGFLNTSLMFPQEGVLWENSFYRQEKNELLFTTSLDRFSDVSGNKSFYSKAYRYHYDRLEYFQSLSVEKKETIFGGNSSLVAGKYGALCIGARLYKNYDFTNESYNRTSGLSGSYEYKKLSTEILFRVEERKNKDRVYEIKWTYRPVPDWRLEFSSIFQKESNVFQSLYEQWSDGENINTILTDRISALKFKLIGKMVSLNISGSRNKQGNEIYYSNIQVQWEF
jgi:hypothetical protein